MLFLSLSIFYIKKINLCEFYTTGVKVSWNKKIWNPASFDRIDSNKPYTKNNIQLTIFCINNIKNNLPDNYIKDIYKNILNNN